MNSLAARLGYEPTEDGVVVTQINQASAAYQAGLREGDVIKKVNQKRVATAGQFNELTKNLKPGDNILLYAKRGQNTFLAAFELE